jgi:hypothetical protein
MKRLLVAATASLLLIVALGAPVAASGQHRSCAGFGALTAGLAPGGGLGQLVSSYAPTGPGVIAGIVASEHAEFCASR